MAVAKQYQNNNIGSFILKWAKEYIRDKQKELGIRLISIDAYPEAVKFYKKK